MTSKKLDRRKKYTRSVLRDSLLQLLKQKPFSALTVKEVCEVADINRSTFYTHYTDLYDLLAEIEKDIIDDMTMYLSAGSDEISNEQNITEKIIEYFAEKQDELEVLLNEDSETSFQKKVMETVHPLIMNRWLKLKQYDETKTKYVSTFIISGSIQVIKTWLLSGKDQSPKEMADLINNMIYYGIYGESKK